MPCKARKANSFCLREAKLAFNDAAVLGTHVAIARFTKVHARPLTPASFIAAFCAKLIDSVDMSLCFVALEVIRVDIVIKDIHFSLLSDNEVKRCNYRLSKTNFLDIILY